MKNSLLVRMYRRLPPPKPSFYAYFTRRQRIHWQARDLLGDNKPALWPCETKMGGRAIAARAGVKAPEIFQGPVRVEHVDWEALPDRFVVKPEWGAASRGVLVIERNGHSYREMLSGTVLAGEQQLRTAVQQSVQRGQGTNLDILIEENIAPADRPAYDWKMYSFRGSVELVNQIGRGPGGPWEKYYDGDWRELGRVVLSHQFDRSMPPPHSPDELVQAAARISLELPTPFVRVDLYEHEGSVVFGELALRPGGDQRFRPRIDRRLGRAWDNAEVSMIGMPGIDYIP